VAILQFVDRPGLLDLGWGHPRPELLPTDGWQTATEQTLHRYGWQALTYGHPAGPGPLVEWLAGHAGSRASEVFVTAGASHALALVTEVLCQPGDVVLVDSPTYHLAFRTLLDRGVDLVSVPADDPTAVAWTLDRLRRDGRRVPMCYLVPTFNNPTGRSLPPDRRTALIDWARRSGVTLVEDDTYRELVYDGVAPPALWTLAEGGPVVRLGSFAKTVAPGLRLGWINAAPEVIDRLVGLGYVHSGGGVNHAAAMTMATFGASGAYDAHTASLRSRYAEQRDALVAALSPVLPVPVPAGGWFLWTRLPDGMTSRSLLPVAERAGVSFADGAQFHVDGDGGGHIRLAYSMLAPDDLVEAAGRLIRAVDRIVGS
jgi:DNA-binding transcriptional MocR family regulator